MKKALLVDVISSLLILLFAYAALSKLFAYQNFKGQLYWFPFIRNYRGLISWSVPSIELVIVALLIIPKTRYWGLISSAAMMFIFTAFLILMLNFGGKMLPCTCGGIISSLHWKGHIVFNLFFLGIAVTGILLDKRSRNTENSELHRRYIIA